jgi:hypothetical protein
MLDFIRSILFSLGVNAANIPDLVLAIGAIIVIVILLRVVLEILEQFISIGCTIISIIVIVMLLIEVF